MAKELSLNEQVLEKKMSEKKSIIIAWCDIVTKYSMYLLVLLLPVFFLPWTQDPIHFNKQTLLIGLVFVALFSWMIKTLVHGRGSMNVSKISMAALAVVLTYGLSTIFSVFRYGSFWGNAGLASESLVSVICFALVYFIVVDVFSEKDIFYALNFFGIAIFITALYGILQIMGLHIIPFGFASNNSFNTIGSVGSLGIFLACVLPLCIIFSITLKTWWKALFILSTALIFIAAVLINYNLMWWLIVVGSFLIIVFWIIKKDLLDGRWMFLPVFFLIVALFFIVVKPQITWLPQKALEVSLSQKTSLAIDVQALKASPVWGSGPSAFAYDFIKYKSQDFNSNPVWNVNFNGASSKVLTMLATVGILGTLAFLLLIAASLFYGVRYFMALGKQDVDKNILLFVLLSVVAVLGVAFFLYHSNVAMEAIFFFFVAAIAVLATKDNRVYVLKSASLATLVVIVVFTTLFIFGSGGLVLQVQRYVAEVYYNRALQAFNDNRKDDAIRFVKMAANNNTSLDIYFNQLALFSLSKLQDTVATSLTASDTVKQSDKQKIQELISDSVNAAKVALTINPKNVENWSTKAYVCQNLVGLYPDAVSCAIDSYDAAIALNPTNPYLYIQQGNTYLAQASLVTNDPTLNKAKILNQARDMFNKAIGLKQDYVLAYFQLALTAREQGNTQDAAVALSNASKYAAGNADSLFQIGLVYYQDKNWQAAQNQFQEALGVLPNYSNALYYLGLTYDLQNQKENAIAVFSKVQQLNPDNQNVKTILANLRAGRSALDGLVAKPPASLSPTAPSPPSTKKTP